MMSYPNPMDIDHSVAEDPLHCEGQDAVFAARERSVREMEGEDPKVRPQRDFKSGETQSEESDWVVPPEDDPLGEGVGPGGQRLSLVPSVCSMKSDQSMERPLDFTGGSKTTRLSPVPSVCSMKSDWSMDDPPNFTGDVDVLFQIDFVNYSQHTTEPTGVPCDVCPKRASKSCLTCTASFCEVHVRQHYTAPALQRHTLVEATEDLEQRLCQRHNRDLEQRLCQRHNRDREQGLCQRHNRDLEQRLCQRHNRDRELYCRTDQTAICLSCLTLEHSGHDIISQEQHQRLQKNKSEMENKTAVPPPGPIEFPSVKPDSVCLSWGPPEGLAGPHRFRVSWSGEGSQEHLEVQDLKLHVQGLTPGEEYLFTVATLSDDGRLSLCVSATVRTDIPPPGCLTVAVDLTSVSVTWSKPEGVDQASYILTLDRDGGCLNTVSTRFIQHRYELETKGKYTISVSTVLKGGQSKPISKTITTSYPVPEELTVISVTPTSANLSWSLHQGMEPFPHSFLISYHSEETELQTTSTESCSTTLTGLTPDTKYTVTVCCELRDGGRSQAATRIIQTGSFVPEGLSVDALNEVYDGVRWSADLSWSPGHGTDQIPHSFEISYHSEGNEPKTISTESCSTTLPDLHSDTQYTVSICTVLQGGKKSKSVSTTFHTSERRIVLLGKSGDGKSSAGNTILGEEDFEVSASQFPKTVENGSHSRIINGRKYTVIDTPGLFDNTGPEEGLTPEIVKSIFDSSPGPHAFLIVMRVGRFTDFEEQVVTKIKELFSDDTFKHAVVVFTHGRDLKGQTIEQFVEESRNNQSNFTKQRKATLKELVDKCNGRFHVIDNVHWNQDEGDGSNRIQLAKLFDTIEEMVEKNEGCYTNDISLLVEKAIQREIEKIRELMRDHGETITERDIRAKAKSTVEHRVLVNKGVAKFSMWLYAAFSFKKVPNGFSNYIGQAAARARYPTEAVREACQRLRLLLLE